MDALLCSMWFCCCENISCERESKEVDDKKKSVCVQFDSNGDGQISLMELREAMKKLMGEQVTNREINEILKDADLNGDGLVDFEGRADRLWDLLKDHIMISCFPLTSFLVLFRVCANDVPLTSPYVRETLCNCWLSIVLHWRARISDYIFVLKTKKEKML